MDAVLGNDTCTICGKKMGCASIGTGTGMAHPKCYYIKNPPRLALTVEDVVNGGEDPVLARELILQILTPTQKAQLVETYNNGVLELYKIRIS